MAETSQEPDVSGMVLLTRNKVRRTIGLINEAKMEIVRIEAAAKFARWELDTILAELTKALDESNKLNGGKA